MCIVYSVIRIKSNPQSNFLPPYRVARLLLTRTECSLQGNNFVISTTFFLSLLKAC